MLQEIDLILFELPHAVATPGDPVRDPFAGDAMETPRPEERVHGLALADALLGAELGLEASMAIFWQVL